jgi:hypothetical protein
VRADDPAPCAHHAKSAAPVTKMIASSLFRPARFPVVCYFGDHFHGKGCLIAVEWVMADRPGTHVNAAEDGPSKLREWTTSTMLIAFTIAVGLFCVLVLTCTLAQTRMSSISIDGANISIWKLNYIRVQWEKNRLQITAATDALAEAREEVSAALTENSEFEESAGYRQARTPLDAKLDAFFILLKQFDEKLSNAMSDGGTIERITRIDAAKDGLIKAHPELGRLIAEIETMGEAYRPIDARRLLLRGNREEKTALVKARQDGLKSLQESLDSLFAAQFNVKQIDGPTRVRVENALFELYPTGFLGSFMNPLIVTPPDYLTLALVISMGVLGSALQMTHALFKHDRIERAGAYFLRLSVGAITALVIFIVAKAGVPVIADASRLGGDAPINPYFVSFLAIISGLMSENAIHSVQMQGARFFASETAPEHLRWARLDLRDAFKKANRNPDNVSRLLNVEGSQFNAWISGKEPIPGNVQMIIAGVLETPRRDLFTDLPPEEAKQSVDLREEDHGREAVSSPKPPA